MVARRLNVEGTGFTPVPGLLQAVDWRPGVGHWRQGIQWQDLCGGSTTTFDECITASPAASGGPPVKTETGEMRSFGATPFTVYAEVDCSAVGFYGDSVEHARQLLLRSEKRQVEATFYTGTVAGVPNLAYPHLASSVDVFADDFAPGDDASIQLQQAAVIVTGASFSPSVALGEAESAFADCNDGTGMVHVPVNLLPGLIRERLITRERDAWWTGRGNRVVVGAGYPGTGPNGQPSGSAGLGWIYVTPPVFGYRGDVVTFDPASSINRSNNTVQARAERTYLLAYGCCLVASQVTTS